MVSATYNVHTIVPNVHIHVYIHKYYIEAYEYHYTVNIEYTCIAYAMESTLSKLTTFTQHMALGRG